MLLKLTLRPYQPFPTAGDGLSCNRANSHSKEIGEQKLFHRVFRCQALSYATMNLGIDFDPRHLGCYVAAEFLNSFTCRLKKNPAAKTRVKDSIHRRADRPPNQEIGDFRVGVECAQRFGGLDAREEAIRLLNHGSILSPQ